MNRFRRCWSRGIYVTKDRGDRAGSILTGLRYVGGKGWILINLFQARPRSSRITQLRRGMGTNVVFIPDSDEEEITILDNTPSPRFSTDDDEVQRFSSDEEEVQEVPSRSPSPEYTRSASPSPEREREEEEQSRREEEERELRWREQEHVLGRSLPSTTSGPIVEVVEVDTSEEEEEVVLKNKDMSRFKEVESGAWIRSSKSKEVDAGAWSKSIQQNEVESGAKRRSIQQNEVESGTRSKSIQQNEVDAGTRSKSIQQTDIEAGASSRSIQEKEEEAGWARARMARANKLLQWAADVQGTLIVDVEDEEVELSANHPEVEDVTTIPPAPSISLQSSKAASPSHPAGIQRIPSLSPRQSIQPATSQNRLGPGVFPIILRAPANHLVGSSSQSSNLPDQPGTPASLSSMLTSQPNTSSMASQPDTSSVASQPNTSSVASQPEVPLGQKLASQNKVTSSQHSNLSSQPGTSTSPSSTMASQSRTSSSKPEPESCSKTKASQSVLILSHSTPPFDLAMSFPGTSRTASLLLSLQDDQGVSQVRRQVDEVARVQPPQAKRQPVNCSAQLILPTLAQVVPTVEPPEEEVTVVEQEGEQEARKRLKLFSRQEEEEVGKMGMEKPFRLAANPARQEVEESDEDKKAMRRLDELSRLHEEEAREMEKLTGLKVAPVASRVAWKPRSEVAPTSNRQESRRVEETQSNLVNDAVTHSVPKENTSKDIVPELSTREVIERANKILGTTLPPVESPAAPSDEALAVSAISATRAHAAPAVLAPDHKRLPKILATLQKRFTTTDEWIAVGNYSARSMKVDKAGEGGQGGLAPRLVSIGILFFLSISLLLSAPTAPTFCCVYTS